MPSSPHNRVAELHNLAAHAHTAATAHGKGDHLTAHELSKQAFEHSMNAHKLSEDLVAKAAKSGKAKARSFATATIRHERPFWTTSKPEKESLKVSAAI